MERCCFSLGFGSEARHRSQKAGEFTRPALAKSVLLVAIENLHPAILPSAAQSEVLLRRVRCRKRLRPTFSGLTLVLTGESVLWQTGLSATSSVDATAFGGMIFFYLTLGHAVPLTVRVE